jgi:menaquinone-dependent protoporphyrinogen oxidase
MKPILILYATREGHTHRIADHLSEILRAQHLPVEVQDAKDLSEPFEPSRYSAAILAASIHLAHHEKEMVAFVKQYRGALERLPAAFLSVSLSEAGVENLSASPEMRAKSAADVLRMLNTFFDETGWHPMHACPIAGALLYSEYGLILRWLMKRIARQAGASTDTSRDHVFTDWESLDRFVSDFVKLLPSETTLAATSASTSDTVPAKPAG